MNITSKLPRENHLVACTKNGFNSVQSIRAPYPKVDVSFQALQKLFFPALAMIFLLLASSSFAQEIVNEGSGDNFLGASHPTTPLNGYQQVQGSVFGGDPDDYYRIEKSATNKYFYHNFEGTNLYEIYLVQATGSYSGSPVTETLILNNLNAQHPLLLDYESGDYYYSLRFKNVANGSYSVKINTTGATYCNTPGAAPQSAVITPSPTSLNLGSIVPGSGGSTGYIVKINTVNSFTTLLNNADNLPVSGGLEYSGSGEQVVYVGTSETPNIDVTGLAPGTTYFTKIYAYNQCESNFYFYENNGLVTEHRTCGGLSASHNISITPGAITARIDSYDASTNADGYVVMLNNFNYFDDLVDGSSLPSANTVWANGGGQAVYVGNSTSPGIEVSGLSSGGNNYFVKVFPYDFCGGQYYFNNSGSIQSFITCPMPNAVSDITFHAVGTDFIQFYSFTGSSNGADGYVIRMNESNSFTTPVQGASLPSANLTYGGGEQVVYVGSSTTPDFVVNGLTENTTYYFNVYAYSDCNGFRVYDPVGTTVSQLNVKTLPTITFSDIIKSYGDANFDLAATSNSTGQITYSIEGIANGTSLSGTNNQTVTLGDPGTVTIRATVAADADFNTGTKDITLTINKAIPTIDNFSDLLYALGDPDDVLAATSNSTGTISYSLVGDANGNVLSGTNNSTLTPGNVGTAILRATVAEDANYQSTFKDVFITVNNPQTIYGVGYNDNAVTSTLYKVSNGGTPEVLRTWTSGGAGPTGNCILIGDTFYCAENDTNGGNGSVFKIKTDGTGYQELLAGSPVTYGGFSSGLVYANGKLWGIYNTDATNTDGGIYSINTDGSNFTVEQTISGISSGKANHGGLVEAGGKLWGVAVNHLFSINVDGTGYTSYTQYTLDVNAGTPAFINGKVYGTFDLMFTPSFYAEGGIYAIDTDGSNFNIITDFQTLASLTGPKSNLVEHEGKIWGVAGTNIFSVDYDGTGATLAHTVSSTYTSSGGPTTLTAQSGRLWSTTSSGGTNGNGIVFSYETSTDTFTPVADLTASSGGAFNNGGTDFLTSPLIVDAQFTDPLVTLADQTIQHDDTLTLNASTNSTGAISYSVENNTTASYIFDGNKLLADGLGTLTIRATVAADQNYNSAETTATITINQADQTITFGTLADRTYGDAPFELTATGGGSGNAITYVSSNTAVATISGSTVTIVGAGTTNITASQAGNTNYAAATDVVQPLTVNQESQTITFGALADRTYGDAPFELTATGGASGNAVTYVSSNTAVATISGSTVTIVGAGTTNITASQAGNTNYAAATDVVQPLTVNQASQTITFGTLTDRTYGDAAFELTATGGGSGNAVTYVSSNTAVATISGSTVTIVGAGTTNITASQAGNSNYAAATDVVQPLTVNQASQTITFGTLADKTYGDAAFELTATGGGSGNAVTYVSSNTAVATISGSTVTIVGAGTTNITASQAGNTNYAAATDVVQPLTVNQASQTITFGTLADKIYGDAAFELTATGGGSGNAVTYVSSNTAVATISGSTVTIVGAGTTNITASQAGNSNYAAATDVVQPLTVNQASQTITFGTLADKTYGDAAFELTATGGGSGNAVTYVSSNTAVATISGSTVTIVGAGTTNITASQAGNTNYAAATDVVQPLTVNQASQTITFGTLADKIYGDAAFELTATGGGSGNAVNYVSSNTAVATISGSTVTIVGAGTTNITASQAGNSNYAAATDVVQPLTVNQASQTITFGTLADKTYGDAAFELTATGGGSGNAVTYLSSNTAVATISGSTVTIVGAGTTNITASQAGNSNYAAATDVMQPLTVNQASQTITFGTLADKTYGDAAFELTATGGASGNAVTYVSSNTAVATISGSTVTIVGAGTTNITASQAGNTNYAAATDVVQPLTVNQASQTITFGTLADRTYGDAAFELTATGGASGNAVTYVSSNTAVATISGSTVTIVGAGTTNITASQAGNSNYAAATDVVQPLTVNKAAQTIDLSGVETLHNLVESIQVTLPEFSSAGLPITYTTSNNPVVASVSGNVITFDRSQMSGQNTSFTIFANQAGNGTYEAATEVSILFLPYELFIWSGTAWNEIPGAGDFAAINGDFTLDQDYAVADWYVETGVTMTIPDGMTLTTTASMDSKGLTIIKSGGSLVTNGDVIGTGYRIERITTFDQNTGRYSIVGSPIANANFSVLGSSALIFGYDQSELYNPTGNEGLDRFKTPATLGITEMAVGKGYFSAFTGDANGQVNFVGTPNSGDINVTLDFTDHMAAEETDFEGFNLVSNPYPSAISFSGFIAGNSGADINGSIYLWDDFDSGNSRGDNSDYLIVNSLGNTDSRSNGEAKWDGNIRSGQGFFVKANSATSVSFTNAMRVTGNNTDGGYFRVDDSEIQSLKLRLSDGNSSKAIVIGFAPDATTQLDNQYDATLWSGSDYTFYSISGTRQLAIQGLPQFYSGEIALGLFVSEAGQQTISLMDMKNLEEWAVLFLKDKLTGEVINLREQSYTFNVNAGETNDRFVLQAFPNDVTDVVESLDQQIFSYTDYGNLYVVFKTNDIREAKFTMFDLSGRILLDQYAEINANKWQTATGKIPANIYILMIKTEKGIWKQKVKVE